MIELYPNSNAVNQIDWFNECHMAYLEGKFDRALVASIMCHVESMEALRIMGLYGSDAYNPPDISEATGG